ncbi:MAG: Na+/H+ antiporter NhaC family protein [Clostridia bacterium]|nr:Na+/H+ antiporter NhaC family protein [Clostridia bacterium]
MKKSKLIAIIVAVVVIVALLVVAGVTNGSNATVNCPDCGGTGALTCGTCEGAGTNCEDCEGTGTLACETCSGESTVRASIWAILPAVIAIALALITKEVYSSLFIGIVSGALLYSNFSFTGTMDALTNDALITAVSDNAGIFIFLVELGMLVALVNHAGGSAAFGRWAATHIKTKIGATMATFVLGILIFIDDYFNCLTVGSVMRPVTDSKKISRAKLAYIIDSTAAPVCMIAPISSWAAAVSSYAPEGEGLKLFITAIPYNFYALLTLVFIIAITFIGVDYGKMRMYEYSFQEKGYAIEAEENSEKAPEHNENGKVLDLLLPIIVLIVASILSLLYVGGIMDGKNFVDAFADTDATVGLPMGGLIALVITVVYLICRKVLNFEGCMKALPKGFNAMVPAILILTFATALKNITSLLGTKYYVYDLMNGAAAGLDRILPAIIFLVACFLAFSTGTSWGTFGILIPIVVSIFPAGSELVIIGMSACLAGAVCGDHCSPISDTTIMSSAGAQCDHLVHVSTQIPYAITVAAISFVMFIIAGFVQNWVICLAIGVVVTVATAFVMKLVTSKKAK